MLAEQKCEVCAGCCSYRGEAYHVRVMWADFSVPLSRNTELRAGFQRHFCMLVMLEARLTRVLLLSQVGIWGATMLRLQTLAWQTEENCGASAVAGCFSVPHTLEDHLRKDTDCIENALQISRSSCGAILARWSPCSSCYESSRGSKAQ